LPNETGGKEWAVRTHPARKKLFEIGRYVWHKTAVPVFIERFLLAAMAAAFIAVLFVNPLKFDNIQRTTAALALFFGAAFFAQTLYRHSEAPKQADAPTLTPVPEPAATPKPIPTLHDLFVSDFPNVLKGRTNFPITAPDGTVVTTEAQLYLDHAGKSTFIGFYVPSTSLTYKACAYLAEHSEIPLGLASSVRDGGMVGERTPTKDLVFTGRVYVYHQDELSYAELASLTQLYESKKLSVHFRGPAYWLLHANKSGSQ
jgi:hypothetical protein